MHRAAIAFCHLNGSYELIDCPPVQLPAVAMRLRENLNGFNVTIPHKQAIVSLMNELTPEARIVHAINTVKVERGRLIGHNTDAGGFLQALEKLTGGPPRLPGVCIIGSGGAARAALRATMRTGTQQVIIYARTQRDARLMRDEFLKSNKTSMQIILRSPGEPLNANAPALIVNCTPIGLDGDDPPEWIVSIMQNSRRGAHIPIFFDMVYSQSKTETPLVSKAKNEGLVACDGLQMLIEQAALSFEFWTGFKVPSEVMASGLKTGDIRPSV
jgi:shikimate dehydrogenase